MAREYKEEILEEIVSDLLTHCDGVHVERLLACGEYDADYIKDAVGDITRFYIKANILFKENIDRIDNLMMMDYQSIRRREGTGEFIISYVGIYENIDNEEED